ncbi:hypothetical protein AtNW77_Chr5g0140591 [Arabidopsis thaliana]|uniref:Uncharacterized protein n=5 Tax=Arabidopsis TaxID=3701 RepID=Q1PDJ2_ARATH|nr:uncharacterized protein AT5G55135 [Arabidopsis thaliana]KAG7606143.1 hypothetical protein ISN45_At05g050870 [Arabidopsis thaliana x Arabidopsis arenosa]KAG7613056.1 hypothetical protein ISN44_As05g050150 [Arabidopsis suecica]ABE66249.1 hypothetical protein At5g55135 [Arabidopsis thaliana]AED96590.1 hypothetical protein AT5G55135 [Arabidopsis thaliana]OAO92409.1 hypothetical protein AXX17_AT5G54260 [Arabidopsis thaliana]|eukprot:NP_680438.1 hypothetical protein AT5G55135 [Arabidopsis thaliana]
MLRNYVNPKSISKPNITTSCIYSFYLKRGSASGGREEGRASSTAEEFTRQGVASQTVEKAFDGAAVAVNVSGDSEADVEKVKEAFLDKKDYNYKKRPEDDDDGLPINTAKGI